MVLNQPAIDILASSLDEASEGGHLPNPNLVIDHVDETNKANTKSYILAIRARLIDLGYLGESPKNRSHPTLDGRLKKAIRKFQREAGLEEDAWVGDITWQALQQLVSFEDDQNPQNWRKELLSDLSGPAIRRAVYLRLYSFGFFKWKQRINLRTDFSLRSNFDFKSALRDFLKIAKKLGRLQDHLEPVIQLEMLQALFQQDEMIHALNQNPDFVSDRQNKRFVESVARIELWMLGFDVSVGNPRLRFKKRKGLIFREAVTHLELALAEFWKQQSASLRPATKKARESVTPEFFQQLIEFEKEDRTPDDYIEGDLVLRISEFSPQEHQELEGRLQNIAGSIWDGVKRVFRWIKRFLKKLVKAALNMIKNIARFIAKEARQAFKGVKKVFEIIYRGIVYLRKKVLQGSDARHMVIYHDTDFDYCIYFNSGADPEKRQQLMRHNRTESVCFGAACRIVIHLVAIFKRVLKTIIVGIGSWFFALLALTRLAMRIKEIAAEVKIVEKFELERDASPFANQVV